jgi:glutamate/tyrosine decarboxylase-like PLP-dependent enzyme
MENSTFRRIGHSLVDTVATFLDSLPDRAVTRHRPPEELRSLLDASRPLPEEGTDPETLLARAAEVLMSESLFNGHPRFYGYVTASPAHIGILAELLAAAVNANVGARQLAPIATEIEAQTVRWLAELIGYPSDCGGLFVSGGNMANFTALLTARAAAAEWNVRTAGIGDACARPLHIYASEETHTWVQKSADMAGIGTDAIRWIPTDAALQMDVDRLRATLEKDRKDGARPLMVIGTAGSVSTGAVDPLFELAEVCRAADVWFHVDGAYGAFAAGVSGAPAVLQGLALADSVAVDPHKWLYAPIEAGCVLVRDREALRRTFSFHPPYYHFGQEVTNYVDFGPQNSRGFRALKVWLALQHVGREGYRKSIAEDMRLSRELYARVDVHPELQAITQVLSITTFRYVPPGLADSSADAAVAAYLNTLNHRLLDRLQESGEAFVSNAVIDGQFALRACIVNFNTCEADVAALPDVVARLGRAIAAEMEGRP